MDYKGMWEKLKELLQRTEKMSENIKTTGVLEIMSEIESIEYSNSNDFPF